MSGSESLCESPETDGMLTDELIGRAVKELAEVKRQLLDGAGEGDFLRECEGRLDNALRDMTVARDRFRKAQT